MGNSSFYRKMMGESSLTAVLKAQRKRIFYGALLWMVGSPLLAVLLGPSQLFRIIVVGGWLILFSLTLRYFYFLFFKKDD